MTSRIGTDYQTGFTFIELIFVTLAIGLLAISAMPHFRQGWSCLQMEHLAFELAQTLRTARTLAITQSQPVDWIWEPNARRVWLGNVLNSGSTPPLPGRLGRSRVIPEQVQLSVVRPACPVTLGFAKRSRRGVGKNEKDVDRISFFPDGTSQSTALLIGGESLPRYRIAVDGSTSQVVVQRAPHQFVGPSVQR